MRIPVFLVLSLVAVLLVSCSAAAVSTEGTEAAPFLAPTSTAVVLPLETATQPAAAEATALPVATSRGPNLEATDPGTVSLASGGLQFVEFFRFT
jgi:hypothetical protein